MTTKVNGETVTKVGVLKGMDKNGVHEWLNHKTMAYTGSKKSMHQTIIVHIGAGGGTGGPIMSSVLRTLAGLPAHHRDTFVYIAVDGDKFETKNLGRQLCTPSDIGKFKVSSLVSKMKRVYSDLDESLIIAVPRYVDSKEMLDSIVSLGLATLHNKRVKYEETIRMGDRRQGDTILSYTSRGRTDVNVVIVDSVDRNSCRRIITEYGLDNTNIGKNFLASAKSHRHAVVSTHAPVPVPATFTQISCGNGAWTGQTLIGGLRIGAQETLVSPGIWDLPDGVISKETYEAIINLFTKSVDSSRGIMDIKSYNYYLPLPGIVHPELLDEELDRQEDAMSCSERAVANVQNLIANGMGACAATNYITALMFQQMHANTWIVQNELKLSKILGSCTGLFADKPQGDLETYSIKNMGFYFNSIANSVRTVGLASEDLANLENLLIKRAAEAKTKAAGTEVTNG